MGRSKQKIKNTKSIPVKTRTSPTVFDPVVWGWVISVLIFAEIALLLYPKTEYFTRLVFKAGVVGGVSLVAFRDLGARYPTLVALISAVLVVVGFWVAKFTASYELLAITKILFWPDVVVTAFALLRYGPMAALIILTLTAVYAALVTEARVVFPLKMIRWTHIRAAWDMPDIRGRAYAFNACVIALVVLQTPTGIESHGTNAGQQLLMVFAFENKENVLPCSMPKETKFFPVDSSNIIVAKKVTTSPPYQFSLHTCIANNPVKR